MPRTARALRGGYCYHVLNRGNDRKTVFRQASDYAAFLAMMAEAMQRQIMRLIAFCLMPNHFHLVVWPYGDRDLSRWMHWLMTTYVRRHYRLTRETGHLWQGRFKAFPIEQDDHLLTVNRYVERNPLRAKLVTDASWWPWSSIGVAPSGTILPELDPGPVPRGPRWLEFVNPPLTEAELKAVRCSLQRGRPFGSEAWQQSTAAELGLEFTLRNQGRPKKT